MRARRTKVRIRKKKQDVIFSKLVRERSNYCCQACGVNKRFESNLLDCAHIMGRRSVALRWHPNNAISLCRACHIFYTEHPFDFADYCREEIGGDLVAELRLVSNIPVKWSTKVRDEIYVHYKKELEKMEAKRISTELMIEFEQHEIMHKFGNENGK